MGTPIKPYLHRVAFSPRHFLALQIVFALCAVSGLSLFRPSATSAQQGTAGSGTPPQQQSQQPAPASVTTGSVSGHVYRSDTGAPLAGIVIGLWTAFPPGRMPLPPPPPRGTRTGTDGSYKFS